MADVKWIKITTDLFDDEKILLIESLPDAYAIITVWFKLLCLAGKQNNSGVFMMNNQIAYTDKMLATIFRMKEATVTMAIQTFEQFEMIEVIDGVITIPNWNKHQTLDSYEKKKERDRLYQQERRAKQKLLIRKSSDSQATQSSDVAISEVEQDKEQEEEQYKKKILKEKIDLQQILLLFNNTCKSFRSVKVLSESRKDELTARLDTYSIDDFKTLFEKAEASDFLKGNNDSSWTASFDWLIKEKNMPKVIEGNYDNRKEPVKKGRYDFEALERMAFDRVNAVNVKDDPELEKEAEELKKMLQETYKKGDDNNA